MVLPLSRKEMHYPVPWHMEIKYMSPTSLYNMSSARGCQWVLPDHGVGCAGVGGAVTTGLGDDLMF